MTTRRTIPIDEAKGPELRKFGQEVLGLQFDRYEKVEGLLAKVKAAWNQPDIYVEEKNEPEAAPNPAVMPKSKDPGDDMLSVIIIREEKPGGDQPVFLAVNGKGILVERGKPSPLKRKYFEVLRNAIQHIYEPVDGGGMSEPREVPLYPYQIVLDPHAIAATA